MSEEDYNEVLELYHADVNHRARRIKTLLGTYIENATKSVMDERYSKL